MNLVRVVAAVLFFMFTTTARCAPDALTEDFKADCSRLENTDFSSLEDAPTQIVSASSVERSDSMPAFCDVKGYTGSSVGIEIALPTPWNGKFVEGGCGGHCGFLDIGWICGAAVRAGYACITSDMGHQGTGGDGLWAHENLQAKIDWGYRATHVAAVAGKGISSQFYKRAPAHSYYIGCSTGGRQGLQEAQHFPWDFDGIVAGAPPVNLATLYMTYAWGIRATHDPDGKPVLSNRELKFLTDAAVARCDKDDGLKDGIIGNPLNCSFDPAELSCSANRHNNCLTAIQVEAARKVYTGPMTSAGVRLSPGGPLPGSENGPWQRAYVSEDGQPAGYAALIANGFKYLFLSPEPGEAWTFNKFDFDRDFKRMGVMEVLVDASNPDLRTYKSAGGKLIVYQGTNDMMAHSTVDYYKAVEREMGGQDNTQNFFRLFLLPGVEHCAGGPGADTVNYLAYLDDWVEHGRAPEMLLAAHMKKAYSLDHPPAFPLNPIEISFTRPVYPYPAWPKYQGHGDPDDAVNFAPAR